jgi:CRP-like cAMP-binding protein
MIAPIHMAPPDAKKLEKLRERWDKAVQKDKPKDAMAALVELEELDPNEARWSHRLGDVMRRLGLGSEAEQAYERAMDRYAKQGFLPRAVAMAKTIAGMNPARSDVLAKVDPEAARALRPAAPPPEARLGPATAVPLHRLEDAKDEVRFDDLPTPERKMLAVPLTVEEVIIAEEEAVIITDADIVRDGPSAEQLARMAASALFADLSPAALSALTSAAELVEREAGQLLVERNAPADALYAIVEGTARVDVGGASVKLGEGEVFGEACLLEDGVRQADVRAEGHLVALVIGRDPLRDVVLAHPEIDGVLFELLVRRLIGNMLQSSELFQAFDPTTRLEIARMFEVRRAEAGVVLAEQGKRQDGLYLLLAGHVELDDGRRLKRGSTFGHDALLSHAASAYTMRAVTESIVLRLPATRFGTFAAMYPPALSHLADVAGRPLKVSDPPPRP